MAEPAGIERRLTSIESRLDNVESGLGNVNSRLENVNSRLENVNSRLENVESRLDNVANDAAAARYLAAAHDRDLADVGIKVDANRRAINALSEQTATRFDQLEGEMRAGFAKSAAGHQQIVGLLNHVIGRLDAE